MDNIELGSHRYPSSDNISQDILDKYWDALLKALALTTNDI